MAHTHLASQELSHVLSEKLEGMLYPSETDSPIDVFVWDCSEQGAFTLNTLLGYYGFSDDTNVSEVPAEEFFEGLTEIYEWHTNEEVDHANRFKEVRDLFFANVTNPKHYWVGEHTVHVFLVGRTCDGNYIGLRTYIVET